MKKWDNLWLWGVFVLASLILLAIAIPATATYDANFVSSLWVGEKKKVIEVSIEDGEHLLEILAMHLEDIAVDNYRGVLWVGTRKEIIQYSLTGEEISRYPLNIKDDCKGNSCGERIVHISLDPSDGSLWIGAKDEVIKLAYDSHEFFRIRDVGHIVDVSVDISDGSCWVGLKDKVIKYSLDGALLLNFNIENGNKIQALATDPLFNSLWIGTKKGLIRVNKDGFEQFRIDEPFDIQDLKVDITDASVWVVTKKEVFKYSSDGQKLLGLDPCSCDIKCEGNLITLAVDPYDSTCWIAWRKTLLKLSYIGEYLLWLNGFKQIEALDIGLPELRIEITEPLDGAIVDNPIITVKGEVTDPTAKVTVNGIDAYVSGNNFEAQGIQLKQGINTITATATNLAYLTVSDTIHVTYQPPIPPLTVTIDFIGEGAIFFTSPINVTGTVSDTKAKVTVNGVEAMVYGNTFTATGIRLNPGENIITAIAIDEANREASDTVMVNYEPRIDISITYPSDGEVLSISPIDVKGIVNDPNAYVEVNGVEAMVSSDGSFTAHSARLYEGLNQITAQATSQNAQTDTDTIYVTYKPPQVPLSVSIFTPEDGSRLESPELIVTGIVSDPYATVIVNDTLAKVDDGFFTANVYVCEGGIIDIDSFNSFGIDNFDNSWGCTITVTAYSQDGQTAISSITYTYVQSENPLTIKITVPSHDSVLTFSPVEIKGEINDVLSGISPTEVNVNGVTATVEGNTFTVLVPLNDGINYIEAHAENMVGSDAYDALRIIYEPATKPLSVLITSPLDNSTVNYSIINVSGTVSDSTATVEVNGIKAAQDFRSFIAESLPLSIGENIITATALRPNGETATATVKVIYDPDYPSPSPPILSELPNYSNGYVEVSGLTLPNYTVEIFVNGENQATVIADSNGIFKTVVFLPKEGSNHISARAIDSYGNKGILSSEAVVIRDTITPSIKNGIFYIDYWGLAVSGVFIEAYTEPFAEIEIIIDEDPDYKYNLKADTQGKFSIFTHLSSGKHYLRITTIDRVGNTDSYGKIHTVHNPEGRMPLPPMIDPIPNPINETSITVEGNAYARFAVELYRDNEFMGTVLTDNRGRFKFEGISLMPGRNILKVRQIQQQIQGDIGTPYQFIESADSSEVVIDVISGTPIRPEVKTDFPVNEAITDSEFLPLRGSINDPDATLRCNGYYTDYGYATNLYGRFVSQQKIPLLPGKNTLWLEAALPDGSRGVDKITVYYKRDAEVPEVKITSPLEGEEVYDRFINVSGTIEDSVQKVVVNEAEAFLDNGNFTSDLVDIYGMYASYPEGFGSMVTAWAMDGDGKIGHHDIYLKYKYIPTPQLYVYSPVDGEFLTSSPVTVIGEVYDATEVRVNDILAQMNGNTFAIDIELKEGENVITVIAKNVSKASVQVINVTYQPSTPVTLQSIAIVPSPATVSLGEKLQLSTIGTYSNGKTVDLTLGSTWISSNIAVATVEKGLVTGKSVGATIITATYGGINGSVTLYVGSPALKSIRVIYPMETPSGVVYFADNPSLTIGETLKFRALGEYSDGSKIVISPVWTSSNPAVATIDSSGLANALSEGTTQITATSQSISGSSTLTVELPPIYIFITFPSEGSTVNKPEITVTGTIINPSGNETGVVVNGIVSTVYGNKFTANNVPLTEGQNTITATATDTAGNTATTSITVNAITTGNYIRLTSNIESGIAPLEVTLRIDGSFGFEESSISVSGPAQPEYLSTSADEYRVKMTVEGIYYFTASVTGPDGNIYRDTTVITLLNKTELDSLLRDKWEGMNTALANQNIEKASTYYSEETKQIYNELFNALYAYLPQIAQEMQEIQLIYLKNNTAKYRMRQNELYGGRMITLTYYIYFVVDKDGMWKIYRY